jgi:hypothetical protein
LHTAGTVGTEELGSVSVAIVGTNQNLREQDGPPLCTVKDRSQVALCQIAEQRHESGSLLLRGVFCALAKELFFPKSTRRCKDLPPKVLIQKPLRQYVAQGHIQHETGERNAARPISRNQVEIL